MQTKHLIVIMWSKNVAYVLENMPHDAVFVNGISMAENGRNGNVVKAHTHVYIFNVKNAALILVIF